VKLTLLLIALASPLQAELLATFQTSQGNIIVSLQYDKAPQTVANFITLAQGTRTRVDPITRAVSKAPLYIGEKFFRVLDSLNGNPDFKIAQTGSGSGTNAGGPGYTFRDEFDPSLTHVPYVLSMANGGPDTNGSQIFFTGSAPIPGLNNLHTVFGLVTDPTSQTTIDDIIVAGDNATTIDALSFERTDAAALAFDEHAQKLPVCSGVAGKLMVSPGASVSYLLNSPQPPRSMFQVFRSPDLQTWAKSGELYQGTGEHGADHIIIDGHQSPSGFYQLPLVIYPDALSPASLANRTLIADASETLKFTVAFDATGAGGTLVLSTNPTVTANITEVAYTPAIYRATWVIKTDHYVPLRFQGILRSETATEIVGTHHTSQKMLGGILWSTVGSGPLSLAK
jgi:peptidyl-prolyl cis-trans isomerase A (cyclophilin A)